MSSIEVGKYTSLRAIVAHFLNQHDKSTADEDKVWLLALRGYTLLYTSIAAEPQTFRIPVGSNKIVKFPKGVVSWIKVGILNDNGEISNLKINNSLTKWRDLNPDRLSLLTGQVNDGNNPLLNYPFYSNYYYNGTFYNVPLFGAGNGLIQYGSCTVDEENEVIVLDPNFRYDSVMFEAIMQPEKQDDFMVLTILQEAIIAFVEWKMNLAPRELYYAAATEARRSLPKKKVNLPYFNQVIRASESMKLRS